MAEIYGHRWTSAYGDNPNEGAALTWAKGLAGISPKQVADGLKGCLSSSDAWPPTLPEFRGMCLSIPSFAAVRLETGPTRSLFTVLVWQYVDGYAHRQASLERADKMLRDAYELAREHVMRGGSLPGEVTGELEHTKREVVVASPEVAAKAIADAKALLGHVSAPEPAEPIERAPRIDLADVEAELQAHYSDHKSAAAGPDQ